MTADHAESRESGYVRCRLCGAGMAVAEAEEHIAKHGRVMTALATDESTECEA